jgi:hypothetical protein
MTEYTADKASLAGAPRAARRFAAARSAYAVRGVSGVCATARAVRLRGVTVI